MAEQLEKIRSSLFFCLSFALATACGHSSKTDKTAFPPAQIPAFSQLIENGITLFVSPFDTESAYNVSLYSAPSNGGFVFRSVQTIPGFHWKWEAVEPVSAFVGGRAATTALSSLPFASLDSSSEGQLQTKSFSLHYKVTFAELAEAGRWPAVVGALGERAGTLALPAFLRAYPRELKSALRIYFLTNERSPLFAKAPAASCGTGCFDFENISQALDTPFTVAKSADDVIALGTESDFPAFVTVTSSAVLEKFPLSVLKSAHEKAQQAWKILNERLGDVESKTHFQTHLSLTTGCSFQGLEHTEATLLSFGVECSGNLENRYLNLAVHEMTHVWNAKHLFPEENASWKAFEFGTERLNKLYFYEGFTEGTARLLNAELFGSPEMISTIDKSWNTTFAALSGSAVGAGNTAEKVSKYSPGDGYQVGSYLALKMFTDARAQWGETVGKQKFWSLLSALSAATASKPAFNLQKAPWQQMDFESGLARISATARQGYSSDDLLQAIVNSMGAEVAEKVKDRFIVSQTPVFESITALSNEVTSIASALDKKTSTLSNGGVAQFATGN